MEWTNLTKVLNDYGRELIEHYRQTLTDDNINASYELYNSLKYEVHTPNEGIFEVNLTLSHYWKFLEFGRKAGKMPPISAIQKWIEVKPVIPRPNANGKLPTTRQLAYIIAKSIEANGIAPKPILATNIEQINDVFLPLIERAIAEDIGRHVGMDIREIGF